MSTLGRRVVAALRIQGTYVELMTDRGKTSAGARSRTSLHHARHMLDLTCALYGMQREFTTKDGRSETKNQHAELHRQAEKEESAVHDVYIITRTLLHDIEEIIKI